MPLRMRKLPGRNKYRVYDGRRVIAKETTKAKGEKQIRLVLGVKHGMKLRKRNVHHSPMQTIYSTGVPYQHKG